MSAGRGVRVLLTGTPSDAHSWNLVYLQLYCEELGHEVINLGACVPVGMLVQRWRRHAPDVVVVSSINGHGYLDGLVLGEQVRRHPDLRHTPMVIGGMLGVEGDGIGAEVTESRRQLLLAAGFDQVLDRDLDELARFLGSLRIRQLT